MSPLYKGKLIVLGQSNSGKDYFFKNNSQISASFFPNSYLTIGVSIYTAHYSNTNDSLTLGVWNINTGERHRFMYSTFLRGASGCLIFVDLLDERYDFNSRINNWLNLIRIYVGNIPIFLVAKTSDSLTIDLDEINDIIQSTNLAGFFLIPSQLDLIFNVVGDRLIEIFRERPSITLCEEKFNSKERKIYQKFLNFFQYCPVCRNKNHENYLKSFYLSENPDLVKLRDSLLDLINISSNFDKIYLNKINMGIPCCSCYEKIFPKKE